MGLCLRCRKPCNAASMLCEPCKAYLQVHGPRPGSTNIADFQTSPNIQVVGSASMITNDAATSTPQEANIVVATPADNATSKPEEVGIPASTSEDNAVPTPEEVGKPVSTFEDNAVPTPAEADMLTASSMGSSEASEQAIEPQLPADEDLEDVNQNALQSEFTPTLSSDNNELAGALTYDGHETQEDVAQQSLLRLNVAAQYMALDQAGVRAPRISRFRKFHDISEEIQRDSTPLPLALYDTLHNLHPQPRKQIEKVPEQKYLEMWPWLQEPEIEENDAWNDGNDPLLSRRLPSSSEIKRIEDEDIRHAFAGNTSSLKVTPLFITQKRLRIFFMGLILFALLALVTDTILLSVAFIHNHVISPPVDNRAPSLTLSTNTASNGDRVTLHMRHFAPSTRVVVTRDVNEAVQLDPAGTVGVAINGTADVILLIDNGWGAGSHMLEAEDISTRYAVNTSLRIDMGTMRPAHLAIAPQQLHFGADIQGANSDRLLLLDNSGSGNITWSASSDQPWLLLSPAQGVFSDHQQIVVAVQRTNLDKGNYSGNITFASNVGSTQSIKVDMQVQALPSNVGAVLAVAPAVLAFSAGDGGVDPDGQVLSISNPGKQALHWSIDNNAAVQPDNAAVLGAYKPGMSWLNPSLTEGIVVPGDTQFLLIKVHSRNLLPGTYTSSLVFGSSPGSSVLDSGQIVSISLTVQPRCGVTLSVDSLSFTAVIGHTNPENQILNLTATASCSSTTSWTASSSENWLTVSPAKGQLNGAASAATTIEVNVAALAPGSYAGNISVSTPQSSQSVAVSLVIQQAPSPSAPLMGVSPLNLNFSAAPGQSNPPGQTITITNTGGSTLHWQTAINAQAAPWLSASFASGIILSGQTGRLTVNVSARNLTPGTYIGQISLLGTDNSKHTASGSPQIINVDFTVLPPCTLVPPTLSALAFTATQGLGDPTSQSVGITASGNCNWPVTWHLTVTSMVSWLKFSTPSVTLSASGQATTLVISPNIAGLTPRVYTTQISIAAVDATGLATVGSPQAFTVTLTIVPPCTLNVATTALDFEVDQGKVSDAQRISVNNTGNCTLPVTWLAQADTRTSWLIFSAATGKDNGSGSSVGVSIDATRLSPGIYNGTMTIAAIGSGGGAVQRSPRVISIKLTVNGFSVSGAVTACASNPCTDMPVPLTATTLLLIDNTGTIVQTVSADAQQSFNFTDVANGSYTIRASGSDGGGTIYNGSTDISVVGSAVSTSLTLFPAVPPTVSN